MKNLKLSFQLATLCLVFSFTNLFIDLYICSSKAYLSFWLTTYLHSSIFFVGRGVAFDVERTYPLDWSLDIFLLWILWALIIRALIFIKDLFYRRVGNSPSKVMAFPLQSATTNYVKGSL